MTIDTHTHALDGTFDWYKHPPPYEPIGFPPRGRSYPYGISRHNLTVTGGAYQKPAVADRLLSAGDASPNAVAQFHKDAESAPLLQPFTLSAGHTTTVQANSYGLRFTHLNAATGVFNGTVTISDPDPNDSTPPFRNLKRTGTFSGIIVNRLNMGVGHILFPSLSPSFVPVFSGQIELRQN